MAHSFGSPDRVALLDRLSRENVGLAGQCGFLQAMVQNLEREIRLLQAPAADPATAEPLQPPRLTGLYGALSSLSGGSGGGSGSVPVGTYFSPLKQVPCSPSLILVAGPFLK